jgi:hypothetical protein
MLDMGETVCMPKEDFLKLKESVTLSRYKYEEMAETIEILTDERLKKDIAESEDQIRKGKYTTWTKLKNKL